MTIKSGFWKKENSFGTKPTHTHSYVLYLSIFHYGPLSWRNENKTLLLYTYYLTNIPTDVNLYYFLYFHPLRNEKPTPQRPHYLLLIPTDPHIKHHFHLHRGWLVMGCCVNRSPATYSLQHKSCKYLCFSFGGWGGVNNNTQRICEMILSSFWDQVSLYLETFDFFKP